MTVMHKAKRIKWGAECSCGLRSEVGFNPDLRFTINDRIAVAVTRKAARKWMQHHIKIENSKRSIGSVMICSSKFGCI